MIEWTEIGSKYSGAERDLGRDDGGLVSRERVEATIRGLDWLPVVAGQKMSLPFSQGYAISEAIQALRIPKVRAIAYTSRDHRIEFGLYGIRGTWADGARNVYLIDEGTGVVVVGIEKTEG